jgi:hypothetical protein
MYEILDRVHHRCRKALPVWGVVVMTLSGCGFFFNPYSPERIARTVVARGPGYWVVSFPYHDVIDRHGPGLSTVRANVQRAKDYEEVKALWRNAEAEAVPRYLLANNLIPEDCKYGVQVVRSGSVEGGGGWAEFECTQRR